MAKPKPQDPQPQDPQLPVPHADAIDFEADAGKGMEGADRDSYAIPFLAVLQPLSPVVANGEIEGAKAGLLFNTVTRQLFPEAVIVPCAYQRRWVRWAPREAGGGYRGEVTTAQVLEMKERGEVKELERNLYFPLPDGSLNEKKCERLVDTRNHFVLVLPDEDASIGSPALLALSSTGIKRSKNFMARINGLKVQRADGTVYNPPAFAHMYRIKTVKESNDQGIWFSPEIDAIGPVRRRSVYELAKSFYESVGSGTVEVAHETARTDSTEQAGF